VIKVLPLQYQHQHQKVNLFGRVYFNSSSDSPKEPDVGKGNEKEKEKGGKQQKKKKHHRNKEKEEKK